MRKCGKEFMDLMPTYMITAKPTGEAVRLHTRL
jgi:hypothetical protein